MDHVWRRHEIQLSDNKKMLGVSLDTSENSLNSNAQDMHKKFLLNINHLSQVQKKHENIISSMAVNIEETKMKIRDINTIDEVLTEFGGEKTDLGINLPFPSENPSDLILQTTHEKDTQIVQIISSEIFGGLLRTFKLPPSKEIEQITWNNGIIELSFM